jgi:hypothetical protein
MGLARVIAGLGAFSNTRLNRITLGMGILFGLIGSGMVLPDWLAGRRTNPVQGAAPLPIGDEVD